MNQDERYHVNRILEALESILRYCDESEVQLPSEFTQRANKAISDYTRYNVIKLYKEQERQLYKTDKTKYYQIRKMRLELEDGHR